jgi:hypothetical protein
MTGPTEDGLLPSVLRDVDGIEDERLGTISVFDGPAPPVMPSMPFWLPLDII